MNDLRSKPHPPGFNHRSSRRFACDRCRAYKARCERNIDSGSCERCAKARLVCTTNFEHVSHLNIQSAGQQQHQSRDINGNINGNSTGNSASNAVREAGHGNSVRPLHQLPLDDQEQQGRDNSTSPRLSRPRSPQGQRQTAVDYQFSRQRAMSSAMHSISDGLVSHEGTSSADSSHSDSHPTTMSTETDSVNPGEYIFLDGDRTGLDGMDFSMDLSIPHLMFDKVDVPMLGDNSHQLARQDPLSRRSDDPTSFGDQANHTIHNPSMNLALKSPNIMNGNDNMRFFTPSTSSGQNDRQKRLAKAHKDLLKLNLELVEDQETLDEIIPLNGRINLRDSNLSLATQDSPIHRVLNRTSRYWEILKAISTHTVSTNEVDSAWQGRRPTNTLLLVHLLTTYICLVRICRAVFFHLYHVLQVIPSDQLGTVLNLPSIKFGEFQMENNPTIQVQALIELSSNMLLRIEEALGISTSSGPGLSGGTVSSETLESHDCRQSIMNDPVAVSLREIILSQERIQLAANGVGDISLMNVMKKLKRLLQQR
ncbi:hypothetical protein AJ79_00055 [Helicocarpus griseus UAMH5409]|uniref:Zn(2)-C6 fungal-type domain-containing protein n=1 Tax=Helicocarpus griseus UAMH5409 TaxID=1447875 RepID=A0A2B7YD86_9EURO|nr:hypothetical protein AJ79_00055 [Helicocarpus griseus UAMH5409]